MLAPLFGYFFSMITMLTAVVVVLTSFSNISTLGKGRHHLRPPVINRTVTVDKPARQPTVARETAPAKEVAAVVSTAKAEDIKKSKHYKPKVVVRQRNNYGFGNALGYAEETRYGPKGLFFQ